MKNVKMHEGLPTEKTLHNFSNNKHNIIVLDDLGHKMVQDKDMEMLFTQFALSVIFILHNL